MTPLATHPLLVALMAGLAAAMACERPGADPPNPADVRDQAGRTFAPDTTWSAGLRVGGAPDDSTLQGIMPPVANERGVFFAGMTAKRVLHFAHAGLLTWTYGSPGGGPDEIREPRDFKLGPGGQVWVLDPANGRLTKLSADGLVLSRIGHSYGSTRSDGCFGMPPSLGGDSPA